MATGSSEVADFTGAPLPAFARTTAETEAVFRFAADHPQVLRYVACSCGCARDGYRNNQQCYVRPDAAGHPVWDPMAAG